MLKKLLTVLAGFALIGIPTVDAQVSTNLFKLKDGKYTMTIPTYDEVCNSDQTKCSELGSAVTTETDPVAGAINGIVKSDGSANFSAAIAGTDYQTPLVAGTDYLAPAGDGASLTNVVHTSGDEAVGGKKTLTDDLVLDGGTYDTTISAGTPTASVTYTLPADDGSLGQFLTTDGTGGTSWTSVSGSASIFDCKVAPSGGDYTTVGAAIAGSCYNVLVSGDTTETGDIALGANNVLIHIIPDVTVTIPNYQFTMSGTVRVQGGGEIDWTPTTSAKNLFDGTGTFILDDLIWDNNGGVTNDMNLADEAMVQQINRLTYLMPNSRSGIEINNNNGHNYVTNSKIVGGGSGSANAISSGANYYVNVDNIYFVSSFSTTSAVIVINSAQYGNLSNIVIVTSQNVLIETSVNTSHITTANTSHGVKIRATATQLYPITISDSYIGTGAGAELLASGDGVTFSGISSKLYDAIVTLTGNHCKLIGSSVGSVSVTGDYNIVSSNQLGATNTVTTDAGADGTIIIGNQVGVTIVDNGSNTVSANNYEY